MIILCLDTGYRFTGYAVWSTRRLEFIDAGVITNPPDDTLKSVAAQNLKGVLQLSQSLYRIASRHNPDLAVAELPHGGARNSRAASCMALAFATTVATLSMSGVDLEPVTPNQIKKLVDPKSAGNKSVDKIKVQQYVIRRFGSELLPENSKREHIADAMAALCVYLEKESK